MKALRAGYRYEVDNYENQNLPKQEIQFYHRERNTDGTTNEELIKVVIDRINFLNSNVPAKENKEAISYFEMGLAALKRRSMNRKRGVEGKLTALDDSGKVNNLVKFIPGTEPFKPGEAYIALGGLEGKGVVDMSTLNTNKPKQNDGIEGVGKIPE